MNGKTIKILYLSLSALCLLIFPLQGCNSDSGGSDRARRDTGRSVGGTGATGGNGNGQGKTGGATGSIEAPGTGADGSESSSGVNVDDLETMPLGELMLLKQERAQQDQSEQGELELLDAINGRLCEKLEDKRKNCPAIKRLIHDPYANPLKCSANEDTGKTLIEVTIPAGKPGSFVLIANDLYTSSAFSSGTTTITFTDKGGDLMAPQFIKIHKLVLRTEGETPAPLPPSEGFFVKITVDGDDLLDELVRPSEDAELARQGTEYSISVKDIINLRKSSVCMINHQQIEELKLNIRNTITQDQALQMKDQFLRDSIKIDEVGDPDVKRKEVIAELTALRSKISARFNVLEGERNRQFKLANELKTDIHMGCHFRKPINSFEIELEGSINDRVYLGKQDQKKPDRIFDGGTHEILFDFGAVKFSLDFSKTNIFGVRHVYEKDVSDESLVGSLDRIMIRKKGVTYDNVMTPCRTSGGIFGSLEKVFWDESCYDVYEQGIFTISALTIYVNQKKAFSKGDLGVKLSRENYKFSEDLQSNEQWVKLMLDEDCTETN